MTERRRHSKVSRLPAEIRDQVHRLIIEGKTIEQIVECLDGLASDGTIAPGAAPSKSSVGRYTKGFLRVFERARIVREQARALVEQAGESGMVLEEAATQVALNEILRLLQPDDGELDEKQIKSIAVALSKLQQSSATRERAKIEVRKDLAKRARDAAEKVGDMAGKAGLSGAAVDRIKKQILGIAQ